MRVWIVSAFAALFGVASPAVAETRLRIMSFNIWGGGGNEEKGIEMTFAVLHAANPDFIGTQETILEGPDRTAESCSPQRASGAKALAEAIHCANETRGPTLDLLFADLAEAEGAAAIFVFGNFNEPSVHGSTVETVVAGQRPVKVAWPTTHRMAEAGFTGTYRAVFPDPVAKPAYTWTPQGDEADKEDHHERIDFGFAKAAGIKVL